MVIACTVPGLGAGLGAPGVVCGTCHPGETARYAATAMGKSLIAPAALPGGRITDATSGTVVTIEERDGEMVHSILEQGLTAARPIRYQIGGGLMGRTYMVQIGDYLFESPASWFNRYGWDFSPGYAHKASIDFDRPIDEACLFCHAGRVEFADSDRHRLKQAQVSSITCDRCHGASEAHVRHPSSKNIVNPAKLKEASRDSVCEQCHLEGATRILNRGKNWEDFHVGEAAETTFATYLIGGSAETIAVSQVEELAQSKCLRASGGKLWCGTCHQVHGEAVDRRREIREICTSCHAVLSAAAHPGAPAECTSCHMPRSATTDIPHAALTDHRILRNPTNATPGSQVTAQKAIAWREPGPEFGDRDLALAEVSIGFSKNLPEVGADGFRMLRGLSDREQQDPEVLSDLEGLSLQQGKLQEAAELGRRVVELIPNSAKAAMNFGIVLKRAGNFAEAERELRRAIDLDPSLKQAHIELAMLYASEGRTREMGETLDQFLKWNPEDILFRLTRERQERR